MYTAIPVYRHTLTAGASRKEQELRQKSYNNMECKEKLGGNAATAFNTRKLYLLKKDLAENGRHAVFLRTVRERFTAFNLEECL